MARFDSAPPILSSRLVACRRRPGRGGTPRTIVSPAVITSRFSGNLALSRASPLPVPGHYPTWRAALLMLIWSPSMIREGEVVGIGLIGRINALEVGERSLAFWVAPGHFVSHLYGLNPRRPQKLLRPDELLYFVKDPDG